MLYHTYQTHGVRFPAAPANDALSRTETYIYRKSSVWRQKGLTGYHIKYIDRPFYLRADEMSASQKDILQTNLHQRSETVLFVCL